MILLFPPYQASLLTAGKKGYFTKRSASKMYLYESKKELKMSVFFFEWLHFDYEYNVMNVPDETTSDQFGVGEFRLSVSYCRCLYVKM